MLSFGDGESAQLWRQRHTTVTATQLGLRYGDGTAVVPLQNPTLTTENSTPGDVISLVERFNQRISNVQAEYNDRRDGIYKTLAIFLGFQGPLVAALFSRAGQIKQSIGCDGLWNTLILLALVLSALVSTPTIAVVLYEFVEQFELLKLGLQLRQERNSLIDNCLQDGGLTGSRRFLLSSYRGGFTASGDRTESYWWGLRCGFLVILIAFSACLLFLCTLLICP